MNHIKMFFHCKQCLESVPIGMSPRDWAQIECGWTVAGFQVWCKRHDINMIHIDFEGIKHPGDTGIDGDLEGDVALVPMELEAIIRMAYSNARENGDDFATAKEWAEDMHENVADLECIDVLIIEFMVDKIIRELRQ